MIETFDTNNNLENNNKRKNFIYIHICCLNHWEIILNEMLMKIHKSGIYDKISEIRCEELHNHEDGTHIYVVYFHHASGRVELIAKSSIKPIFARQVSKVY